jgi:hypothetical protein
VASPTSSTAVDYFDNDSTLMVLKTRVTWVIGARGVEIELSDRPASARLARLSYRDAVAKDVEILILRHQLAVAQRRTSARELQRKLTWSDRAWLALLAGLIPKHHLEVLRRGTATWCDGPGRGAPGARARDARRPNRAQVRAHDGFLCSWPGEQGSFR